MATNEDLDKRLSKLEHQGMLKFFVQYLLSPLLIISIGAFINWQVERNKAETQRIDLAQKMMATLFSGNADQAFATERLMARVVDPQLAEEVHQIVAKYYQSKLDASLKSGNVAEAASIVASARSIGGDAATQVVQSVEQNSAQSVAIKSYRDKAQEAAQKEREGFEALIAGNYDAAAAAFEAAEAAYSSYHNVYELGRLARTRKADLADPAKRKDVFKLIVNQYAYGAPPDLIGRLREMAGS